MGVAPPQQLDPTLPDAPGEGESLAYPATIDRYQIEGVIGAGGMGVVLSANDPDLGRKVALKLVVSAGTQDAQARLLREARAAAQLSHANVVAVHDVGVIGDRVWVAMERVDGEDLEAWLAKPRLLGAILDVFVQAGRGLAAAHAKSIVHRDFKPANVLVGRDGRIMVADFGLARMALGEVDPDAQPGAATEAVVTRSSGLVGTPAYMAPEQLAAEPVTAAADQFAFCVALYRAVTGRAPFAVDDAKVRLAEIASDRSPSWPRGTPVPGWLRAVLVRGLRRDPRARFASMDALLVALDAGRRRRARRWIVAGGASVVVIGGGLAAAVLLQGTPAPTCRGLEHHVAGIWGEAQRASVRAAFAASPRGFGPRIAELVISEVDRYANEWTRMRVEVCEATRVRGDQSEALLDARNLCLDRQLGQLSAFTALIAAPPSPKVIDEALGAAQRLPAVATCAEVERLSAIVAPSVDPAVRERIAGIERELARASVFAAAGDSRAALPIARAALVRAEPTKHAPLIAAAARDLGDLERQLGNFADAELHLDRALTMAVEANDVAIEAEVYVAFVELRRAQKRPKEAIALRRPTEVALGRAGSLPGQRIALLRALAAAYRIDIAYQEQRAVLEQALALAEATYGPDHAFTAGVLCQLGPAIDDLRDREQALVFAERCLSVTQRVLAERHPEVGRAWHLVGIVQNGLQRRADAEASYQRAISIIEETSGPDDPYLANVYADLSTSQRRQAKRDAALASAERALAIDRKAYGDGGHVNVGLSLVSVGHLLRDLERYEQALASYREANQIFARLLDPEHPYIGTTYGSMGETYEYMKRFDDAVAIQERALAILIKRPEHCAQPFMVRVTLAEPMILRGRAADRARVQALLREARDGLQGCGSKASRELEKLDGMMKKYGVVL